MAKGRKKERQPPPITGCGFLDGVMPETLQRSKNAYRSNLIVTCYPSDIKKAICDGLDATGKAYRYSGMSEFLSKYVKIIPNKQLFRLFVSVNNFDDFLKHQHELHDLLRTVARDDNNWLGADVHVFVAIASGRMEQYAHDGILPTDVQSAFEFANFGFMYNPIRQSFECQKSTGIPAMVGYHYPFKLPEQKDEE